MDIQIRPATPVDLNVILSLLEEAELPTVGVNQHIADFLVASDGRQIIGCIGIEIFGNYALLRSLIVAEMYRKQRLGLQLTNRILAYAQANAVKEVVLLTNTASSFFAHHFGFVPTERVLFQEKLGNSPEWKLGQCASATCMRLTLA